MPRLVVAPPPADAFGSLGVEILVRYGELLTLYERLLAADEPQAAIRVQRAVDLLGYAHRHLYDAGGTAILEPGQPEPVDTWPADPEPAA